MIARLVKAYFGFVKTEPNFLGKYEIRDFEGL